MEELFGIPTGTLAVVLATLLGVVVALVGGLALRNRVFFRLGVRNVRRRRARTALIVLGLMLGTTIISSALASGDTMSHTIRASALESLGSTDELISARGAEVDLSVPLGETTGVDYFSEDVLDTVAHELLWTEKFDGIAPAIIEPVAVQDVTSRQNEPRVTLFASSGPHLAAFGEIDNVAGGPPVRLDALRDGEVYLNEDAAEDLGAHAGDRLRVLAGPRAASARVRAIVRFDGAGTTEGAVFTTLAAAQSLLERPGEIKHILISNIGDETAGVRHTDEIEALLRPTLQRLRLDLDPVKRDALELADAEGNAYMSMFTTFGSFSIMAGILLIFLIFVMLAAERRGELGIARAVGTRRGHLVQMYLFEGLAYDLLAAAVGAAAGIGVSFGMVLALSSALGTQGISIEHDVNGRSMVVAYALGVLLTFVVVSISALRVSRLNIVTAIRNLSEPPKARQRRRLVLGVIGLALGLLMVARGIGSADALPFLVGGSLALIGAVPVARALGVPERIAYTAAGLGIVTFSLLPFDWLDALAGTDLKMSFSVWIAAGLLVVVGAAWVIVYNADVLLGGTMAVAGRVRSLAPVLRLAMAYPLRSRFRTGITLAMFTLVVFTLVVGTVISGSFLRLFDDIDKFGGGFDVRASAAAVSPIDDPQRAVAASPSLDASRYDAVAAQSFLPVEARQLGAYASTFEEYPVRGVDETFARRVTYAFAATARGYADPWKALASAPRLAIVDGIIAPRRDAWSAGAVMPDFKLRGFFVDDRVFDAVPIEVRDPQTGRSVKLKVIGVLSDTAPLAMQGITTSQDTLRAGFGERVRPTIYYFDLADGVDARVEARKIEAAFLAHGVEADAVEELLDDAVGVQRSFNWLIEGFMGLGLVVGVAALGVISARAVVERRQQIGILRAIGFRRGMIQLGFLLESSFIAATAIVVGTVLGLICAENVLADVASNNRSLDELAMAIPWLSLALVFGVVYAVALVTTIAPAIRASRIYPAEALRYE